jgi:hypothetical protein
MELFLLILIPLLVLVFFFTSWQSNHRILLVKDMRSGTSLYYWESIEGTLLSPEFDSISDAKKWWVKREFNSFRGEERRKRISDRRQDHTLRIQKDGIQDVMGFTTEGRRHTDINIKPDIER